MKQFILFWILCSLSIFNLIGQGLDEERRSLSMLIERMYNNDPFEGCRLLDDYDHSYLINIVTLDKAKYTNKQAMNRVAQVKSQRSAGEYLNGTQSFSEFIIKTPKSEEKGDNAKMIETIEVIKTNTTGFVQQMQVLTAFDGEDNARVFVFYKELK